MKRSLVEAVVVSGLALVLAIITTSLRPDVLAFFLDDRSLQAPSTPLDSVSEITVRDALQALKQGHAQFVDARSPEDFQRLHIRSARNLPEMQKDIWLNSVMSDWDPDTFLIVYCGNRDCHLAGDLSVLLLAAGFNHVFYMKAGLAEWQRQGLPTETGE
jgi:rhodanese-related sulfurtransferase